LKRHFSAVFLLFALISLRSADAQEWTRFRGPNGSGVSEATTIPIKWTEKDFNWRIELPGVGHSSPVLWEGKLFLTTAELSAGEKRLLCIDAKTGKTQWSIDRPLKKEKKHKNNSFVSGTPTVDAERVYVLWQSKGDGSTLVAYHHDGKQQWQYEIGKFKGGHGPGVSPILYDDAVIVCNDQDGASSLLAIDCKTGKQKWSVPRRTKRTSYATPCIYRPKGGPPQLIFTEMHHGITSIDPTSGKQNWEISVFGTFKQRSIASPVIAGDLVIGSSGFTTAEKNYVAVRPTAAASGFTVKEVYRVSKGVPHIPSPLIYGDWMFMISDRGIGTCVEHKTGEVVWQERIGGNYMSSPVCANGKLYCADTDGQIVVLAASDKFEVLARNSIVEGARSTPAISGGKMYVRTFTHLISLGGAK
jgi:outer membrane protein assembly factor BamB